MLKVISLWEPWSTLLAIKAKRIETRGWDTDYRGPVAIHSTKGGLSVQNLNETCFEEHFFEALDGGYKPFKRWNESNAGARLNICKAGVFPHGHILAVGQIGDCLPTESTGCLPGVFDDHPKLDTPQERAFGDFSPGRFGLVFEKVVRLQVPVPFKSRQGKLLELDIAVEDEIYAQINRTGRWQPCLECGAATLTGCACG